MATVTVTVCDACQAQDRLTRTWAVHGPEATYTVELCEEHEKVLVKTLSSLTPKVSQAARRKAKVTEDFVSRVTSMEDLEARKQPK